MYFINIYERNFWEKKKGAVAEQAELSGLLIIHEKERTIFALPWKVKRVGECKPTVTLPSILM